MKEKSAQDISYELRRLSKQDLKEAFVLEQRAFNTATTWAMNEEQLAGQLEHGIVFGAWNESKLMAKVGFTHVGDELEIDIGVDPEYQNKGIGKRLMPDAIKEVLLLFPGKKIFLKVHPDNLAGRKVYEKVGFKTRNNPSTGEPAIEETDHGPRILMTY